MTLYSTDSYRDVYFDKLENIFHARVSEKELKEEERELKSMILGSNMLMHTYNLSYPSYLRGRY
jgi:hypothetical protein